MKKIKISQLPLFSSLKGLFTIGTDDQNRSVKVSLEFIETETNNAVNKAETAASQADRAATDTKAATTACQTATTNANNATTKANNAAASATNAASSANTATFKANTATTQANEAKSKADEATAKASQATAQANQASQTALESASQADAAASNAITVKLDIQETLDKLIPTGLSVICPTRLTMGNPDGVVIANLTPGSAIKNVIFISDDKAVEVDILTGRLTPVACGKSRVRVIPTTNVKLTKTLLIEVGYPTIRLSSKNIIRLTSGGAIRKN